MSRTRRVLASLAWPALCVGLVLAFHARAVPPGQSFTGGDLTRYFFPVRAWLLDALHKGDLPLWQRSIDAGFPTLGSSEFGLLHVTTWLFPFNPVERSLTLGLLLHLVAVAVGGYAWLRRRGMAQPAAAVAGLTLALGGFSTVHLEHWTFSASAMWLPWTLLALDAFAETGQVRWFAVAAATHAASWFGGAGQIAWFNALLAGGYALTLLPGRRHRWPVLLAIPAGLLLATPVLLPVLELAKLGPRAAGTTLAYAGTEFRWPGLQMLAGLLLPHLYGPADHWNAPGTHFWEATGYAGAGVTALAFARRPRNATGWYFLVVLVLALGACFGTDSPIWRALHSGLPGYSSFRVPPRALYLVTVALAYLSASALDDALQDHATPRWRILPALGLTALVALGAGTLHTQLGLAPESVEDARWAVGILVSWGALLVLRDRLPAPALALGLVVTQYADLSHHFSSYVQVADASSQTVSWAQYPSPPNPQAPRISLVRKIFLDEPMLQGLEAASGYSQAFVGRMMDLTEATRTGTLRDSAHTPVNDEYGDQIVNPLSPLFPLYAASGVSSGSPLPPHPLLRPTVRDNAGHHYHYLSPLPIASWVSTFRVEEDASFRASVRAFRPLEEAVVAPGPSTPLPPANLFTRVPARVLVRTNNTTELEVDAPTSGGLLLLQDPWFPGWRAELDGAPVPVLRANYAFMAVEVPVGNHAVTFRYRPATAPLFTALVLGVLLALGSWGLVRRRQSPLSGAAAGSARGP